MLLLPYFLALSLFLVQLEKISLFVFLTCLILTETFFFTVVVVYFSFVYLFRVQNPADGNRSRDKRRSGICLLKVETGLRDSNSEADSGICNLES